MTDITWAGAWYGATAGAVLLAVAAFIRTKPPWFWLIFLGLGATFFLRAGYLANRIETSLRTTSDPRKIMPVLGNPTDRERCEFTLTVEQPTWQVGLRAAPFFRYELTNASDYLAAYLVIPARGNEYGWVPPPLQPMALAGLEDYQQPGLGNPVKPGRAQFEELTDQIGKTQNLIRFDLPASTRAVHECLWPHPTPPVLVVHWYRPPEDRHASGVPLTLEFATRPIAAGAVTARQLLGGVGGLLGSVLVGFLGVWFPAERLRFLREGFSGGFFRRRYL